jgi:CTP:molybdopterin cytidylyltransferase MocA
VLFRSRYGDGAGSWGPPCLFPSDCFAELVALGGERGARSVLQRHLDRLIQLPLPEAAYDVDTREDLERIVRGSAAGA